MDAIWWLNFFLVYFVYRSKQKQNKCFFSEHVTFALLSSHGLLISAFSWSMNTRPFEGMEMVRYCCSTLMVFFRMH